MNVMEVPMRVGKKEVLQKKALPARGIHEI
jgi:hypothetical protein